MAVKKILLLVVGLWTMALSTVSYAVTECGTTINRVLAGDDGNIWLIFDNGLSAYMVPSDPDTKNIFALATTAVVADKQVIIRFQATGVSCTSGTRNDVVAMWLVR